MPSPLGERPSEVWVILWEFPELFKEPRQLNTLDFIKMWRFQHAFHGIPQYYYHAQVFFYCLCFGGIFFVINYTSNSYTFQWPVTSSCDNYFRNFVTVISRVSEKNGNVLRSSEVLNTSDFVGKRLVWIPKSLAIRNRNVFFYFSIYSSVVPLTYWFPIGAESWSLYSILLWRYRPKLLCLK